MFRAVGCVVLAACVVACCGCGRKTQTVVTPEGEKITITEEGSRGQITIEGPEGQKFQLAGDKGSLKLPEGFPADVPVFPKARLTGTSTDKHSVIVSLETTDSLAEVMQFYTDKLKASGWEIQTTVNTEDTSMLSATKQERNCTMVAQKKGKGTTLTVTISKD